MYLILKNGDKQNFKSIDDMFSWMNENLDKVSGGYITVRS